MKGALRWTALAAALFWSLAPIFWMVATSFKTALEATRPDPTWLPASPTLENYVGLAGGSLPFLSFFVTTTVSCLATAVLAMLIATPAAYALSRGRFRLRGLAAEGILVFRMLPLVVLLPPLYLMLLAVGLLDSLPGLVIGFTTFGLPFAIWMMKGFIDALPIEIEEAARVDGCGPWQILLYVVVPLVLPGLLTTATFVFMEAWNNLMLPLSLINTLAKQTLPAAIELSFNGQFKTDWGGMMAASTVTTVPLMVAFFAVQRSMVRGLTGGAVAGS